MKMRPGVCLNDLRNPTRAWFTVWRVCRQRRQTCFLFLTLVWMDVPLAIRTKSEGIRGCGSDFFCEERKILLEDRVSTRNSPNLLSRSFSRRRTTSTTWVALPVRRYVGDGSMQLWMRRAVLTLTIARRRSTSEALERSTRPGP